MDDQFKLSIEDQPAETDVKAVQEGLGAYNRAQVGGEVGWQRLAVFLRSGSGVVEAGLVGSTSWGWLYVESLWVGEVWRGQGRGWQLLQSAEAEARRRGCRYAHLDTMSFQALPFYRKQGYRVYGTLKHKPAGTSHQHYFLWKDLVGHGPAPSLVDIALQIAAEAHAGQTDKAGAPYILHPLRMMLAVEGEMERVAALLHDVIEDGGYTLEHLARLGIPQRVLQAVDALTRRAGESYEAFVQRAAADPIARTVKIADLQDNMDIRRLPALGAEEVERLQRYRRAWEVLTHGR